MIVQKKRDPALRVCCLGEDSAMERRCLEAGTLRRLPDGRWEVFTCESGTERGELARSGDFIKQDSGGGIYPVRRERFLQEHRKTEKGYEQIPRPLTAWRAGEERPEALRFLLESGRLRLSEEDPACYFRAERWGAALSAPRDAVLVFHRVERGADGRIRDADFNFVAREIFEQSYEILGE